jgi:acyl-CoA thioester hydrolase
MPRHRVLTPLRWSDMDAYGHVNNVQFLRLLEDARVIAFAAHGSDEGGSMVSTGLIVARSEIEYLHPLVFRPAPVAIDVWVTDVATANFDLGYEVLDQAAGDGESGGSGEPGEGAASRRPLVYARAETRMVVYDLAEHRPRRLTPDELERLEGWRDGPVVWRHRRRVDAAAGPGR